MTDETMDDLLLRNAGSPGGDVPAAPFEGPFKAWYLHSPGSADPGPLTNKMVREFVGRFDEGLGGTQAGLAHIGRIVTYLGEGHAIQEGAVEMAALGRIINSTVRGLASGKLDPATADLFLGAVTQTITPSTIASWAGGPGSRLRERPLQRLAQSVGAAAAAQHVIAQKPPFDFSGALKLLDTSPTIG